MSCNCKKTNNSMRLKQMPVKHVNASTNKHSTSNNFKRIIRRDMK